MSRICRLQIVKPYLNMRKRMKRTNITSDEISKNETFKIYDGSGLSTTTSDPIANKDNSQSSNTNSQNIPNVVKSISDNTESNISDSDYRIKTYVI